MATSPIGKIIDLSELFIALVGWRGGFHEKGTTAMRLFKVAAAGASAASMLIASSALAAQPVRASQSMPVAAPTMAALRTATPLKHKSLQAEGGAPVLGYALGAVVLAGIVAAGIAGSDNGSDAPPSSPG
jgi:hypothetical protein